MATKTINTRIGLKYDSYANWTAKGDWQGDVFTASEQGASTYDAGFKPLKGEVVFYEIPSPTPSDAPVSNPPAILFKVGDGTNFLKDLPWGSAIAADVYAWAKQQSLLGGTSTTTEGVTTWTWSNDQAYAQEQAEVAAFVKKETAAIKIRIVPTTPPTGHEGEDSWYDTEVSTDNGVTWIPSNTPFKITIEAYTAGDGLSLEDNQFSINVPQTETNLVADSNGLTLNTATVEYAPAHNTQYEFTSYGAAEGGTQYSTGVAEKLSETGNIMTIKVVENPNFPEWVNREFTVDTTNGTSSRLQLMENGELIPVWVEISETVPAAGPNLTGTAGVVQGTDIASIKSYVDAKAQEAQAGATTSITVEKLNAAEDDFAATYVVKQDGVQVGAAINIPKDFLVKSAALHTVDTAGVPYQNAVVGDKYIDFVVNTKADGDGTAETDTHIYLPVNELVDVYTATNQTGYVTLAIDANNNITATAHTQALAGAQAAQAATYYTAEEAAAYNTEHGLNEGDEGYKTEGDVKTPAVAAVDGLATAVDVKTYVDEAVASATPNIEGQEAIEVTASGNSKVVSLKLNDDAQNDQYSGLKQGNNGLEIDDDLTWYLQCGGAE